MLSAGTVGQLTVANGQTACALGYPLHQIARESCCCHKRGRRGERVTSASELNLPLNLWTAEGPKQQIDGVTHIPSFLTSLLIRDKPIAPASPRQNGFAERLIGSIWRECLDHVVVLGEARLRRILKSYADYDNSVRTRRSLHKDAPKSRPVHQPGFIRSLDPQRDSPSLLRV